MGFGVLVGSYAGEGFLALLFLLLPPGCGVLLGCVDCTILTSEVWAGAGADLAAGAEGAGLDAMVIWLRFPLNLLVYGVET